MAIISYVPENYKLNNGDFQIFIDNLIDPTWKDLLIIDFMFNHEKPDYDEGLSFLDRLHQKLGRFHPDWDIVLLKNRICSSENPQEEYINVIMLMLSSDSDIAYYGV